MPDLVSYSDSEEDEHPPPSDAQPLRKRKASASEEAALPGLPDSFLDLYATPVRTSTVDDPTLHGGRQRTNVHRQGNWPSHVFVEWRPGRFAAGWLRSTVRKLQLDPDAASIGSQVKSSLEDDVGTEQPLHISLSRSLNLKTDERDGFLRALGDEVRKGDIKSFKSTFSALRWFSNYEKNRWFLVAQVKRPAGDELNGLLAACNRVAARFEQPVLYAEKDPSASSEGRRKRLKPGRASPLPDPAAGASPDSDDKSEHFHVSIAWTLVEPSAELDDRTRALASSDKDFDAIEIQVSSVKVKIGNAIETIHLGQQKSQEHGLLG